MAPAVASERRLRLVRGYPDGAYPPPRAYDAGLCERYAIVFDASRPDAEGMFLDVELFLRLVGALLDVIPHDRVLYAEEEELLAFEPPAAGLDGAPAVALEPPEALVLTREGRLVGLIETECRVRVGAAEPFHDAYTVALYTRADRSQDFEAVCERVGGEVGAKIEGAVAGAPRREPFVPLWKRPLRWMGRKAW